MKKAKRIHPFFGCCGYLILSLVVPLFFYDPTARAAWTSSKSNGPAGGGKEKIQAELRSSMRTNKTKSKRKTS